MKTKTKKQISYGLLAIGFLGFIYAQNMKSDYEVFSERVTSQNQSSIDFSLLNNHNYLFSFWGNDESSTMGPYASLEVEIKIIGSDNNIITENVIYASGSEDKGGYRRAANGEDIEYFSPHNQQITIQYHIVEGDYLDIEIYEDLPQNAYWMPVLFIAIFITGLVLFMKARASVNVQGKPIQTKKKK